MTDNTAAAAPAPAPGALVFAQRKVNVTLVGLVWIGAAKAPAQHVVRTTLILPATIKARHVAATRVMESAARQAKVDVSEVEVHHLVILTGHAAEVELLPDAPAKVAA